MACAGCFSGGTWLGCEASRKPLDVNSVLNAWGYNRVFLWQIKKIPNKFTLNLYLALGKKSEKPAAINSDLPRKPDPGLSVYCQLQAKPWPTLMSTRLGRTHHMAIGGSHLPPPSCYQTCHPPFPSYLGEPQLDRHGVLFDPGSCLGLSQ